VHLGDHAVEDELIVFEPPVHGAIIGWVEIGGKRQEIRLCPVGIHGGCIHDRGPRVEGAWGDGASVTPGRNSIVTGTRRRYSDRAAPRRPLATCVSETG
jgi:hypothetical protein